MKRMMLAGAAVALAMNGAAATAGEINVGSAAAVTGPIAELVVAHRQCPQPRREPRE